jgi:transcriptional regulator with XRE-family HTH domain
VKSQRHARTSPDPEAVLTKAVLAAARRLGLTNRELAEILGTSEASVSRLHRERALRRGSREAELAALFVRLFRSLDALTGGDEAKARAWYEAPNAHLGDVPAKRASSVEGLVNVVQYLDAMRGKL